MKKDNRGGARPGAGRKSKSEEMKLIEQLDKHIDNDDVILMLKGMIEEGDFKALQLYMNYYFGKPTEHKTVDIQSEQPLFDL